MSTEWRNKIIDYIKRNRVSTTEIADCLGKSGAIPGMTSVAPGLFRVGVVRWVYGYNCSNYPVHKQIIEADEGEIVFIEVFNCEGRAIIGELVSKYLLVYKQASAIISNAPFRDANNLIKNRYAIWCNGFNPIGCFNSKPDEEFDQEIETSHHAFYDGAIAVCDDTGVVLVGKEHHSEEFYNKVVAIEEQEDIWFDCLDRRKWNTFDIVCKKRYLTE